MSRTNVYIDGFNLFYGALKASPYKWLDPEALCHHLLPKDSISRPGRRGRSPRRRASARR
jgi:hypothetical protein